MRRCQRWIGATAVLQGAGASDAPWYVKMPGLNVGASCTSLSGAARSRKRWSAQLSIWEKFARRIKRRKIRCVLATRHSRTDALTRRADGDFDN